MWRCPNCLCQADLDAKPRPFVCTCGGVVMTSGKFFMPRPRPQFDSRMDARGNVTPMSDDEKRSRIEDYQKEKEKQGNRSWCLKHTYYGCDREWHTGWENTIPSVDCSCRKEYEGLKLQLPPRFDSPEEYWLWGVELHNLVNAHRGVDQISVERARILWRHELPPGRRERLVITIATGKEFRALARITAPLMADYAQRCDADFILLDNITQGWWGLEKFRAWHFAQLYDETLFLDVDCIVRPTCRDLFGRESQVAMHDDYHYLTTGHAWLTIERDRVASSSGVPITDVPTCYNSGVVYTRRAAADVWRPPANADGEPIDIGTSHCAEQIWVEHQARRLEIEPLDSRLNWQYYFRDFDAGLEGAEIIHLATCPTKLQTAERLTRH